MKRNWWYKIAASKLLERIQQLQNASVHKDEVMSSRGSEIARLRQENQSLIKQLEIQTNVVKSMDNDASLAVQIIEARKQEVKDAEARMRRTPTQEWVESAQVNGMKTRIQELETQVAKMDLLRDALRNEVAFAHFLEDCLFCLNPSDIFNALPLEKRKEYFERQ